MPLVNAKCTNCGANLTVDEAKDAAICQYCGSAFIVEKAINNYNVVNNINAGVVNVYGATNDFDIRGGVLVKYNGSSVNPVIPDGVVKIGESAFTNSMIESVVIPNSVRFIGEDKYKNAGSFKNCKLLKSIVLPDSIEFIGNASFRGCSSLVSVLLPNNEDYTMIGRELFYDCINLKSIDLPNTIEIIGGFAFCNCRSLNNIVLPDSVEILADGAFMNCLSLSEVKMSDDLINNYAKEVEFGMDGSVCNTFFTRCFEFTNIDTENGKIADIIKKTVNDYKNREREGFKKMGRCQHCGGRLDGVFRKKCTHCGRPKDY